MKKPTLNGVSAITRMHLNVYKDVGFVGGKHMAHQHRQNADFFVNSFSSNIKLYPFCTRVAGVLNSMIKTPV